MPDPSVPHQLDDSAPATVPPTPRRLRVPIGNWVVVAAVGALAALVLIRLGAALLGLQVFAGADLLSTRAPWSNGGPFGTVENPFVGDTIDVFAPAYLELRERLFAGDVPWWSTTSAPGMPLLSSINLGVATPLSIWLVVFPVGWALGLVKLLQLLCAFGFLVLWLRRVGIGRAGATVAGLAYCGTGFFVAWANWVPQATTAALMPALFWAIERLLQQRRVAAALPVAAVVAFLLLAGFPAAAGHALYAAAAYFLVRLLADRRTHSLATNLRTLGTGIGAVLLGTALSAVQLAPFLSRLDESDLDYRAGQFFGELPFRSLLSTVLPRAFTLHGYPASNAIESYAFLGAGTILLAVLALLAGRMTAVRRGVVPVLAVAILLAGAIAWFQGWWTDWLSGVPILSQNAPGRLRDLVGLFASALAGIGLDALLKTDLDRFVARSRTVITTMAGSLGVVALIGLFLHYRGEADNSADLGWDVALGVLTLVLLMAAAACWRRRVIAEVAASLSVLVLATQVIANAGFYWPNSDPADFFPENSLIAAAQQRVVHDRALLLGTFLGSTSTAYGIRTVTGHTFQPLSWSDYILAIDPQAYTPPGRTSTNPSITVDLAGPGIRNPLLDRLGARWVLASPAYPVPGVVRSIDRQAPAGPGTERLTSEPRTPLTVPIASGPIRGVQVATATATPKGTAVRFDVGIIDEDGSVLATGAATRNGPGAGWQSIAVAGEDLPQDGRPLTLTVTTDAPVVLAARGTAPSLRLVVPQDDGLRLTAADTHGALWERMSSLPRIRWAGRSVAEPSAEARLALLGSSSLPSDTVVLDAEPGAGTAGRGGAADVTVVADTGDRIVVDVDAADAGRLVVAEPLQSGWSAAVDGAPAEIAAADQAFGAVAVPAGRHRIELRFEGARAGASAAVTGGAAVVFLGIAVWGLIRRRRRDRTPQAAQTLPTS